MIIRLLMLCLCRNKAQLRIMARLFARYRRLSPEQRAQFQIKDKRVSRSMRLSLLWALFSNQIDTPGVVAIGLLGIVGLVVQGLMSLAHHIAVWTH